MVKVVERLAAHYEVRAVQIGKVYRWCPEKAIVECDCGETLTLDASATHCDNCGEDHALLIQQVLDSRLEYEIEYPGATCNLTSPRGVPREVVERIRVGIRDLKQPDQMGLLLRFPRRRKPVGKDQRDTSAPLRPAQQTGRRMPRSLCEHRLLSVDPIVSLQVEGGYAGRCLLCGTTGPVRGNGEAARNVLLEQMVRDE